MRLSTTTIRFFVPKRKVFKSRGTVPELRSLRATHIPPLLNNHLLTYLDKRLTNIAYYRAVVTSTGEKPSALFFYKKQN